MRLTFLTLAALVATPALAQPPTDWSKPVTGVDAPPAAANKTTETYVIIADSFQNPVQPITIESIVNADGTPLPPPCEAPPARSPETPPGPPAHPPAPCRP